MEPIYYASNKRNYENALTPNSAEPDAKRICLQTPVQLLLDTKNLAELAQAIHVLSQQEGDPLLISNDDMLLLCPHLQAIFNQVSIDQWNEPGYAIHLEIIIGSLRHFLSLRNFLHSDLITPLLSCLTSVLSSESTPCLSSQAVGNLFSFVKFSQFNPFLDKMILDLVRASVRHVRQVDRLQPETIDQILNPPWRLAFIRFLLADAMLPHISHAEPFDPTMLSIVLSYIRNCKFDGAFARHPELYAIALAFFKNMLCSKELGLPEIKTIVNLLFEFHGDGDIDTILYDLADRISCITAWDGTWPEVFQTICITLQHGVISDAANAVLKAFTTGAFANGYLDLIAITEVLDALSSWRDNKVTQSIIHILALQIEKIKQIDLMQSCDIFFALSELNDSVEVAPIIKALGLSMQQHNHQSFSSSMYEHKELDISTITRLLDAFANWQDITGIEAIMKAMALEIQNHSPLDFEEIGEILKSLSEVESSERTKSILKAVAWHIQNHDPLTIDQIGKLLRKMPCRVAFEILSEPLVIHIGKYKELSVDQIIQLLKRMFAQESAQQACPLLKVLEPHIERTEQFTHTDLVRLLRQLAKLNTTIGIDVLMKALLPSQKEGPFQSLLCTRSVAEFNQEFKAFSLEYGVDPNREDSADSEDSSYFDGHDSEDGLGEYRASAVVLGFHLRKIINESLQEQSPGTDCKSHLLNIMDSFPLLNKWDLTSIVLCIAEFLSDESEPWLSSEEIGRIFAVLVKARGREILFTPLEKILAHNIRQADALSPQTICSLFAYAQLPYKDEYTLEETRRIAILLEALLPHIPRAGKFDTEMLYQTIKYREYYVLADPERQAVLTAFIEGILSAKELLPGDIRNVIHCLRCMECLPQDKVDAILSNLTAPISRVEGWCSTFSKEFYKIVKLLTRFNPAPSIHTVLNAFVEPLLSHEQLNFPAISQISFLIYQISSHWSSSKHKFEALDFIKALELQIKKHQQFDAGQFDEMLDLVIRIMKYESNDQPLAGAIMRGLASHISKVELDEELILKIGWGLIHLYSSDTALQQVLGKLCESIDHDQIKLAFKDYREKTEEEAKRTQLISLAQIIHILILSLQKGSKSAAELLKTVVDNMPPDEDEPINRENIDALNEQRKIIIQLLRDPQKPSQVNLLDMTPCLAEFYLKAFFNDFHNQQRRSTKLSPLNLLYGKKIANTFHRKVSSDGFIIIQKHCGGPESLLPIVKNTILNEPNFQTGEWLIDSGWFDMTFSVKRFDRLNNVERLTYKPADSFFNQT